MVIENFVDAEHQVVQLVHLFANVSLDTFRFSAVSILDFNELNLTVNRCEGRQALRELQLGLFHPGFQGRHCFLLLLVGLDSPIQLLLEVNTPLAFSLRR